MEKDRVIFRVDSGVFAMFPEMPGSKSRCRSFDQTGEQEAMVTDRMKTSREATPEEYGGLASTLTRLGYHLKVVKRETKAMREVREACITFGGYDEV